MRSTTRESRSDRAALARDAGLRKVSLLSVLAGTLATYGAVALLATVAAAAARGVGFDGDLSRSEWREVGMAGGIITAALLLLSYLFGGYVAGRMSRRAGPLNGFLVFTLSLALAVAVGALLNTVARTDDVVGDLRLGGVPFSGDELRELATIAGLTALATMLIGAVLGGALGERWHGKLVRRAYDPGVGTGVPAGASVAGRTAVVDDGTSIISRSSDETTRTDTAREHDVAQDDDANVSGDQRDSTLRDDRERARTEG